MSKLRIQHFGQFLIETASPLAEACVTAFDIDNFCPLCNCHPQSGHAKECPLVVETMKAGKAMEREPEGVEA